MTFRTQYAEVDLRIHSRTTIRQREGRERQCRELFVSDNALGGCLAGDGRTLGHDPFLATGACHALDLVPH